MKAFEYAAPRTEEEAVELLGESPRAEVLAGGTDLVGLMKAMIVQPDRLVNIMEIESLKSIDVAEDGHVQVGAAVTLDRILESSQLDSYAALKQAVAGINSMQLQCQGTIGGDLCQRPRCWFFRSGQDLLGPAAEQGDNRFHAIFGNQGAAKFVSAARLAPALIALDAHVRIAGGESGSNETWLSANEFFRTPRHSGQREVALGAGELLTHIQLAPMDGRLSAHYEVKHGCGPEDPLATAAVSFTHSGGIVQDAVIVMGHVAPTPWRATAAADSLRGVTISLETAERAATIAVADATPLSQNEYKVQLAKVAVQRAILQAAGLETGGF